MNAESVRRFPWASFSLLLIAYACLGWLLANPAIANPAWFLPACQKTFDTFGQVLPLTGQAHSVCSALVKENFLGAAAALSWVVIASTAFISPLTSFNSFILRWFKSDTIAFLALCIIAGMVAFALLWLQLFLHVSAILASEALARLDLQTSGLSKLKAFWILLLLSLVGLLVGWSIRLSLHL
jgi:hypothetical protein